MSRPFRQLTGKRLADPEVEQSRRETHEAIVELQRHANTATLVIANVELADGVATRIQHGLGRAPRIVKVSVPRGALAAGYINEIRGGTDRAKLITLQADDYGATVTVDVEVGS